MWYQSPYPEEYTVLPKIYICEFCLKYMKVILPFQTSGKCETYFSVLSEASIYKLYEFPPGIECYEATRTKMRLEASAGGRDLQKRQTLRLWGDFVPCLESFACIIVYCFRCVVRSTSNTARTFAWSPSLSLTTRHSTMTLSRSSSTWWPRPTRTAATSSATSARRRTASSTIMCPVSSHFHPTRLPFQIQRETKGKSMHIEFNMFLKIPDGDVMIKPLLPLAQRLWSAPHRLLLPPVQEWREDWQSGEALVRPWTDLVQGLLEGHPTLLPLQLSREGNQCQGHQWRNGWVCQSSYWKWLKSNFVQGSKLTT